MRGSILLAALWVAAPAWADPTCTAAEKEKKLAGATKTRFMKKCVEDAMGGSAPGTHRDKGGARCWLLY